MSAKCVYKAKTIFFEKVASVDCGAYTCPSLTDLLNVGRMNLLNQKLPCQNHGGPRLLSTVNTLIHVLQSSCGVEKETGHFKHSSNIKCHRYVP